MSNNSEPIKIYQSFSGWTFDTFLRWRIEPKQDLGCCCKILTEVAFIGLTLLSTIETVFRIALSLVLKVISLCIPGCCLGKWFHSNIYEASARHAAMTTRTMIESGMWCVLNFSNDTHIEKVNRQFRDHFFNAWNFWKPFRDFHLIPC